MYVMGNANPIPAIAIALFAALSALVWSSAVFATSPPAAWIEFQVKPGDSLSLLFSRAGIPASDWMAVLKLGEGVEGLRHLRPGDELSLRKTADGRLAALRYRARGASTLRVRRAGSRFMIDSGSTAPTPYLVRIRGQVTSTLLGALLKAGVSSRVAYEFIDIFRPRYDLTDVSGASFAFVFHRYYSGHHFVRSGPIIAAELTLDGNMLTAFRYTDNHQRSAYYDRTGVAIKPAILRAPLTYTDVSSPFSHSRMDPIAHVRRPHTGVDLAAPKGTPIEAAADGTVTFIGRASGYGKLIVLDHAGPYSTRYAHMHGFADGLHTGSRVRRGQVIGYVGETGEATGPHLHFEIRVDGRAQDPLAVDLPAAKPISPAETYLFRQFVGRMLAELGRGREPEQRLFAGEWHFAPQHRSCRPSPSLHPVITFAPLARIDSASWHNHACAQ